MSFLASIYVWGAFSNLVQMNKLLASKKKMENENYELESKKKKKKLLIEWIVQAKNGF